MVHIVSIRVTPGEPRVEIGVHRKPEYAGHASYYTSVALEDWRATRPRPFWSRFLQAVAFCDIRLRVK